MIKNKQLGVIVYGMNLNLLLGSEICHIFGMHFFFIPCFYFTNNVEHKFLLFSDVKRNHKILEVMQVLAAVKQFLIQEIQQLPEVMSQIRH